MEYILNTIKRLADEEYARSSDKFGAKNNSPHESYAVILEEYDEADDIITDFKDFLDSYWSSVKINDKELQKCYLDSLKIRAEHIAAEWVQVVAMCHKAQISIENKQPDMEK